MSTTSRGSWGDHVAFIAAQITHHAKQVEKYTQGSHYRLLPDHVKAILDLAAELAGDTA
jgi:hypothetical protein